MADGLEAAIEAAWVELERQAAAPGGGFVDRCGIVDTGVDMADLVAAVVEALGLREERVDSYDFGSSVRWVSGWSVVGGDR